MTHRRFPAGRRGLLLCGLLVLLLPAPTQAQVSFTWEAGLSSESTILPARDATPEAGGAEGGDSGTLVRIVDRGQLALALAHPAGRGRMEYRLSGELYRSPLSPADPNLGDRRLLVYPAESYLRYTLPPDRFSGASFRISLGRIPAIEPSGTLLESIGTIREQQLMDGLALSFRYPGLFWSLAGGYLGLLDKYSSNVILRDRDAAALSDPERYGGASRGLILGTLEAAELFWSQDLAAVFVGQMALGDRNGAFDSWYIGPVLQGPIAEIGPGRLRHKSSTILALPVLAGETRTPGLRGDVELRYPLPLPVRSEAYLTADFVSGGGGLGAFPRLDQERPYPVVTIPVAARTRLTLGARGTLLPGAAGRRLQADVSTSTYFLDQESAGVYGGTSAELQLTYRVFRDLETELHTGFYGGVDRLRPFVSLAIGAKL